VNPKSPATKAIISNTIIHSSMIKIFLVCFIYTKKGAKGPAIGLFFIIH
jgi:hypothetical protein